MKTVVTQYHTSVSILVCHHYSVYSSCYLEKAGVVLKMNGSQQVASDVIDRSDALFVPLLYRVPWIVLLFSI